MLEKIKEMKLQYKCSLALIFTGSISLIFFWNNPWLLLSLMFILGGFLILIIYLEKKWIKQEYLKYGIIATIALAVVYGMLEYVLFDSTWNNWFKISDWFPDKYYYWIFMALLNFSIVFIASRKSLALSAMAIPLFSVNEDLWYWISKSIHQGTYVFPVSNWFDVKFPFLHGLGEPIPFLPFWPRFYFVGWLLISILIVIQLKNLEDKKFLIALGIFVGACFSCMLLVPL
ncbi:MAG: hypothetical protein ACTSVY_09965 [Candidatus Helarchaeota archaeon]